MNKNDKKGSLGNTIFIAVMLIIALLLIFIWQGGFESSDTDTANTAETVQTAESVNEE